MSKPVVDSMPLKPVIKRFLKRMEGQVIEVGWDNGEPQKAIILEVIDKDCCRVFLTEDRVQRSIDRSQVRCSWDIVSTYLESLHS